MTEESSSTFNRQLRNVIETQIARRPFLVQMRAVLRQMGDERENWSFVIPLAVLLFFMAYRAERKKMQAMRRRLAD